jgi:hypothetical protein
MQTQGHCINRRRLPVRVRFDFGTLAQKSINTLYAAWEEYGRKQHQRLDVSGKNISPVEDGNAI